jgi:superfamily II DNA or RNA helicase
MLNFTSIKLYRDEQLRDYQLENKLKIYEHLEVSKSVMLQMPTGTGKTRLFASIVKDIHNLSIKDKKAYKVLILAHRNELIKQISENVGVQYGIAHGKIMSKNWEEDYYPTQVASVQTLIRRLDKWGDKKFDFIIIDEAHHALAPTYVKICNEFPEAKVLGVTATPYRMSKSSFRSMFDELIVSESISEFIKKGYLSEYEYYSIKPSSKIQNLVNNISEFDFDGDYAEKALSNTFDKDKIRANLLDTYFKYADGKKGIVYTINKRHNEHVCNMFIDAGIIAKAIDSDTNHEERNRIVKDFKNGNIQILCNVNIFSEGFDCPDVEFIQLARPTKSLSMYLQQVGRGFRIHEAKEKVIFLDNVGLFNRFGLPSANRKWLKHFNGSKDTEEFSQDNNNNETVRFIEIDIEEGNEEFELIYNSNKEEAVIIIDTIEFEKIQDFDLFVYENENININNINSDREYYFDLLLNYDESVYKTLYESLLNEFDEIDQKDTRIKKYTHIKKILLNNKWGLWNEIESKIVLEPLYDEINFHNIFSQVLLVENGKSGVFNPFSKTMEVPLIYHGIETISNMPHYHIIELNNEYGIISKVNNIILEPFCDGIIEYNLFFNIETENEWLLFDSNLEKINFYNFEIIEKFNDYDIIKHQNMFAFSHIGKIIFPFLNESYKTISDNRIIINYKGWSCLLDENLEFIIKPSLYSSIEVIGDNFLKVKNIKYGVLTLDGEILIPLINVSCDLIENSFF